MPGKCSFQDRWLRDKDYKDWVRKVLSDKHVARCAFCDCSVNIASMGESMLKQHAKSVKHQKKEKQHQSDSRCSVADFFAGGSTQPQSHDDSQPTRQPEPTHVSASTPSTSDKDLWDKAEVSTFNFRVVEPPLASTSATAPCQYLGNATVQFNPMAERTNIFEALNIENGEDIGEGSHVAHQQHPSPVPSSGATFQRPSECAFTSPDPPAYEVPITADGTEEPGGTATEGVQTLGGVASLSPARPANSSSPKKRRAENKNFGLDTRARQPDYSENSIVLEYYQMLIEKERKEMEMAAEKHRLAVERDGLAIERERLAMEKDRLAMEKDQQLIDIGKQVVRCIAFSTEAVEVIKQKFEAELKENRKL